ncbi:homocysteine S-methyltransferase [Aliiruegeria haliotis]|uniref:Homocysteine S-methyltransferase n=1 Tax=Aliiruegeria haliotis TaxID=1280846 RepID=A0A2T0RM55_9RHOB|nr:homocysteine S-methyltransferase family protein [Aliiruegeria haliotis]PRY22217.1 homocysteine S-methyltransferase [Aliiruegeria haliotis]
MKDHPQTATLRLPHEADATFLMDGGVETTLIFHDKLDLPYFAAFTLFESREGTAVLRRYFRRHLGVAMMHGLGFILETPTWRASADWGALLGFDSEALARINTRAVAFLKEIRSEAGPAEAPIVVSGCIGPRGDGYVVGTEMSAEEAEAYHRPQVESLAAAGVEMITALTMTYAAEAIGIVRAAQTARVPVVVAFTTETDGRLPTGQDIGDFVEEVDAATDEGPIYFMINCAHPSHFDDALQRDAAWLERIGGVRANASRMSHAELDEAENLDAGDPVEFGHHHVDLAAILPNLKVMGGCCGTDHRHIENIAGHFTS